MKVVELLVCHNSIGESRLGLSQSLLEWPLHGPAFIGAQK